MRLTSSKKNKIVEFMVCGERIKVDRKTIMAKCKFFEKLFSSSEYNEDTFILEDAKLEPFKTLVKLLEGDEDVVNRDNVHDLLALARNVQCEYLMLKCFEYFACVSEDDKLHLSVLSLETAVEMEEMEENEKAFITTQLSDIFCPSFVVRHKEHILQKLTPKAQKFILGLIIADVSRMTAHIDKTDGKVKKLEQKSSILEAQLRKALEELRSSKDQQKTLKDAEIELSKLKKKLDLAEKKTKSQEEELEKLRKRLTSGNKKNQMLHKELKESLQATEGAKNDFDAAIERERIIYENRLEDFKTCFNKEMGIVDKLRRSHDRKLNKEIKSLKSTIFRLHQENQAKATVSKVDAESSTKDLMTAPATSCIATQTEEECYRLHDDLAQIWGSSSPKSLYIEDVTAPTMTFNKYEWKKRQVWNKALFL